MDFWLRMPATIFNCCYNSGNQQSGTLLNPSAFKVGFILFDVFLGAFNKIKITFLFLFLQLKMDHQILGVRLCLFWKTKFFLKWKKNNRVIAITRKTKFQTTEKKIVCFWSSGSLEIITFIFTSLTQLLHKAGELQRGSDFPYNKCLWIFLVTNSIYFRHCQ